MVKKRQEETKVRRELVTASLKKKEPVLSPGDILFGVLEEDQVGVKASTDRMKIAKEVLEEMRRYMRADTGESHDIKVDKIQTSVRESEKDPMLQRVALRLEHPPVVITELNKGKGSVFNYKENMGFSSDASVMSNPPKLMADSFKALASQPSRSTPELKLLCYGNEEPTSGGSLSPGCLTVFRAGHQMPCYFGTTKKRQTQRRRPPKSVRLQRAREVFTEVPVRSEERREGKQEIGSKKRKSSVEVEGVQSTNKAVCLKSDPK